MQGKTVEYNNTHRTE